MDMKKVQSVAEQFENDTEKLARELKRVQSVKCRLKKQKGKATYQAEMTEVVQYEELLKEARQLLEPKDKPVTQYGQEDVDRLDFDETIKAIRSIQSKKTLSRWLTDVEGDNDEYKLACQIESMLIDHKKKVQPVEESYIRKTDLVTVIDTLKESGKVSTARVIEMLEQLL